ncbi:bestrophin-like domain [Chelatococcus reniformis]|uniref:DUF4239 domain-containing protein n=1 Tax=Chelatococcus reniformis TaxID=1494448 RepID=A0A916UAK1_9HYPH|nr:DUF4239 domain-containing protein [Chelatococcus reniformis]GGC66629.1 hypothetical protein GCM10010994_26510 [Chelatococcus reniformis]
MVDLAFVIGLFVFAAVFGGAMLAIIYGKRLRPHHRSADTRDVVKLAVGMVAAMTSLMLGLLVSSVKGSFDETNQNIRQFSTYIVMLDSAFRRFGPEADAARGELIAYTRQSLDDTWPDDPARIRIDDPRSYALLGQVARDIRAMAPMDERQQSIKSSAIDLYRHLVEMRWRVVVGNSSTATPIVIVVLTIWITLTFASFGLFSPRNGLTVATMFVCSLSVAGAMALILDMGEPFGGICSISPEPVKNALAHQLAPLARPPT